MSFNLEEARKEKRVAEVYGIVYPAALDEIERLQADNKQLDHEVSVARNLASLANGIVDEQAARIGELEAENENHLQWGISNATDAAKLRVRIEDLEGWLVEERAFRVGIEAANEGRLMDCLEAEKVARRQLQSEGKISSSDHIAAANKLMLTKEQREALEAACQVFQAAIDRMEGKPLTEAITLLVGINSTFSKMLSNSIEPICCLTPEQRVALEAIRDLVTSATRSEHIDAAVDVLDSLLASAKPTWEVTEERKTAIDWVIEALTEEGLDAFYEVGVLRAMLEETK